MPKTTPLLKGLITGALILITTFLLGYLKIPASSGAQYLVYILYALGVGWTIYEFSKGPNYTGKFGELFGQGFRCFIIVTLMMVLFTFIYVSMNPSFGEDMSEFFRKDLTESKKYTPDQINDQVTKYRKSFTTTMVSMTIFQYLILGAIFTAAWSAFILLRNRK